MKQATTIAVTAIMLLVFILSLTTTTAAQTVTPISKLDLDKFMGTWYQIERYPIKSQKVCVSDAMMLYAFGDKRSSFQIVTSCLIKDGNSDSWNFKGKLDKNGSGALKVNRLWPFSSNHWVLATGPAYEWALVGSPNHNSLWILSRTKALEPAVLAEIEAQAAAKGFATAKLIKIPQPH
jgi:apolipoprotein D and lipocalin family protein